MAKVKKSVPPVLMAWATCRNRSGVKPGQKMSARQKSIARICVMKELKKSK
jgi:hypothetical protein